MPTRAQEGKEQRPALSGGKRQDSLFGLSLDPTRLAGCGFRPSVSRRNLVDTRSEEVETKIFVDRVRELRTLRGDEKGGR
jgi:hypothetical protein